MKQVLFEVPSAVKVDDVSENKVYVAVLRANVFLLIHTPSGYIFRNTRYNDYGHSRYTSSAKEAIKHAKEVSLGSIWIFEFDNILEASQYIVSVEAKKV